MRRSPARFLAPIALVAVSVALYSVVQDSRQQPGSRSGEVTATPTASSGTSTKKSGTKRSTTYTVKSGDTLSGIAEKTNVSLEKLKELNPGAQTLSPGQKIRLSK